MTTPGKHDFVVVRGTTDPFTFRLKSADPDNPGSFVPMPLTDLRLTIKCGSDVPWTKSLENGDFVLSDPAQGQYTWTPKPEDTRKFKGDNKNTYELEIRNGPNSEMVYLTGTINGIGGLNEDAAP